MRSRGLAAIGAGLVTALLVMTWPVGGGPDAGPYHDVVPLFTDTAAASGFSGVAGNFFSWGDYDGDGYDDLLIDGSRLFRNGGPPSWTFTEVTATAFPGGTGGWNGAWADFNNDGWLDLYTGASPSFITDANCNRIMVAVSWDTLWRNNGDGTFTNVTVAAGRIYDLDPTGVVAWGDYDRDGNVDLFVAGTEDWYTCGLSTVVVWFPDHLYRNNGNGTFTEVTDAAGMSAETQSPKYGRSAAWGDFNDDGWPDLSVGNYRQLPNYLWKNNGDGTFTDVAPALRVDNSRQDAVNNPDPCNRAGHTVGAAWADMDDDGDWDLAVGNLNHKDWRTSDDSALYNNSGAAGGYTFTNVRGSAGIHVKPYDLRGGGCSAASYWTGPEGDELIVGVSWADIDNDGYEDLWFPQIYADISYAYSYLYRNNGSAGPGTFTEVGAAAGTRVWDTYGGAWSDYDRDGDMDLATGGRDGGTSGYPSRVHLFRNGGVAGHHWLEVALEACTVNGAAIGAVVRVEGNRTAQMRQVEGGMGAHSQQNSLVPHFGLGDYGGPVNVTVTWPDGSTEGFFDVAADRRFTITQHTCTPHGVRNADALIGGTDVVLSWSPPVTVANLANYAVYGSTAYDPTNASYAFLAETPRWTTTWHHVGEGQGSTSKWFYVVQANTTTGESVRSHQLGKMSLPLVAGVNLLSIPVWWPGGDPGRAFASTLVTAAWAYPTGTTWWSWVSGRSGNTLILAPVHGLVVRSAAAGDLAVAGRVESQLVYSLPSGWRLIGIPRLTSPIPVSYLTGQGLEKVLGFDPAAPPGYAKPLADSDVLPGGSAVWVWTRSGASFPITG